MFAKRPTSLGAAPETAVGEVQMRTAPNESLRDFHFLPQKKRTSFPGACDLDMDELEWTPA